jgi:probable HAF family extracellular repeat protein
MWFITLLGCLSGKVANHQERSLSRRSVLVRHRNRCARSRPRLEGLEDRTVPSGSYVFTTIDVPNGTIGSTADGINSHGDIVGVYAGNDFVQHGFLLSGGHFTTLDVPNAIATLPFGINDRGQIVGQYADASFNTHGFLLSGGQYTTLDVPNGFYTFPGGINDRGQIVGGYNETIFSAHGFLLSGGQYTTFDDPNGVGNTIASCINAHGDIAGLFFDANFNEHGFLLRGGQYTTLDVPNGDFTTPQGINSRGQIVGLYLDTNNFVERGFLLSGGQYTNIDDPDGIMGTGAQGISDSGMIVGEYFDANGFGHAFLATPGQQSPVAPSPGVRPGNSAVMGRTPRLNPASLDHASLLRIQVNGEAGGFGGVLGQGLGRTVPGPTTTIVTVPTRNADAAGLHGQDSGTRFVSVLATRNQGLNGIEYDVFDRNDKPFDLGWFVQ